MGAACCLTTNNNQAQANKQANLKLASIQKHQSMFSFGMQKRQPVYSYEGENSLLKVSGPK